MHIKIQIGLEKAARYEQRGGTAIREAEACYITVFNQAKDHSCLEDLRAASLALMKFYLSHESARFDDARPYLNPKVFEHTTEILDQVVLEAVRTIEKKDRKNLLRWAVDHNTQNIDIHQHLAQVYFEQKNYKDARTVYLHIISLNIQGGKKTEPDIYFDIAECSLNLNEIENAIMRYNQALEHPDVSKKLRIQTLYKMGLIMFGSREMGEAARYLAKAKSLDPKNREIVLALMAAQIGLGRGLNSQKYLKRAKSDHPEDPSILNNLGVINLRRGNIESARKDFKAACALQKDDPIYLNNYAVSFMNAKEFFEAEAVLRPLLKLYPRSKCPEFHYNLGYSLNQIGLRHYTKDAQSPRAQAANFQASRYFREAAQHLATALDLSNNNHPFLEKPEMLEYTLAQIHYKLNNFQQAKSYAEQAQKSDNPSICEFSIRLLQKMEAEKLSHKHMNLKAEQPNISQG